ncbi:hypothetical protein [Streptomyces sp. NPDC087300]|uniref:hypothetical protein n=1 Tax=Streptomyces sp. NPDC087300 TaxID=3365780 RepID=UPI0038274C64
MRDTDVERAAALAEALDLNARQIAYGIREHDRALGIAPAAAAEYAWYVEDRQADRAHLLRKLAELNADS